MTAGANHWRGVAVVLVVLAGASCLTQRALDVPADTRLEAPRLAVRREKDRDTGRVVHEWTMLGVPGQRGVRSGADRTWYRSGAREWEREYDHDAPCGTWRKWHENGQLASETRFAGPAVETTMRFWHANGALAAEGPARDGERCGAWRFWRADGVLAERGTYRDSLREGEWWMLDPDGIAARSVTFARNVRVASRPAALGDGLAETRPSGRQ